MGAGCLVEMEMKLVGGDMEVMAPSGLIKPVRNPCLSVSLDPGLCCPSACGTRYLSIKPPERSASQAVLVFCHNTHSAEATAMGGWVLVSKHAHETNIEQLLMCQELRTSRGRSHDPGPRGVSGLATWSCLWAGGAPLPRDKAGAERALPGHSPS